MYENRAGIMNFAQDKYSFDQVRWVDHPYWLPDFMNAFDFSLPYVADNVSNIVLNMLLTVLHSVDSSDESVESDEDDDEVWRSIQAKLRAAKELLPKSDALRKRTKMLLPELPTFDSADPNDKFKQIRNFDRKNERRPPRRHIATLRRAQSAKW